MATVALCALLPHALRHALCRHPADPPPPPAHPYTHLPPAPGRPLPLCRPPAGVNLLLSCRTLPAACRFISSTAAGPGLPPLPLPHFAPVPPPSGAHICNQGRTCSRSYWASALSTLAFPGARAGRWRMLGLCCTFMAPAAASDSCTHLLQCGTTARRGAGVTRTCSEDSSVCRGALWVLQAVRQPVWRHGPVTWRGGVQTLDGGGVNAPRCKAGRVLVRLRSCTGTSR